MENQFYIVGTYFPIFLYFSLQNQVEDLAVSKHYVNIIQILFVPLWYRNLIQPFETCNEWSKIVKRMLQVIIT